MNPFEDFFKAVRNSMALKTAQAVALPPDLFSTTTAFSASFYAGVPTASLYVYLQGAEKAEAYEQCLRIQQEIKRREG